MIELVEVAFHYAERLVLSGVNLNVDKGQIVVLGGPNGAGKSTLLRLALGLESPSSGSVRFEGKPIERQRRADLAKRLAYVPQAQLPPMAFTVEEVVLMGRAPHAGRFVFEREEDLLHVRAAMRALELEPLAGRALSTLSGGERRRVALARALAQTPRALVLDEPAAHLDLRHRVALFRTLRMLSRREGLGCLMASHDLGLAAQYADRVALLAGGRLLADGTPQEVIRPELLEQAFGVEVDVALHPRTGRPYLLFGAEAAASAP